MRRTALLIAFLALGIAAGAAGALLITKEAGEGVAPATAASRYYCPMHPTMTSDEPADCPVCQMRMVPMEEPRHEGEPASLPATGPSTRPASGPGAEGRAEVQISPEKRQLIGVRTAPVERRPLIKTIRTVGRVAYDETRLHHVHTKVGGWIERLYTDATGELVTKGQPLLTIYSPELLASQQEYLLALRARDRLAAAAGRSGAVPDGEDLVASARRRLRLFDLTDAQIEALESSGEASRTTTLHAPIGGYIISRNVTHGEKIEPGTSLLDIADLSRVWVLADVYEYELPFVRSGQKAIMTLSYLAGRTFEGRVSLVYPFLSGTTRTAKVRLEFPNPELALKPEMFAEVELRADLGVKLVVPDSAVISTGKRDIAFVDMGEGRFEPRELRLGVRLDDAMEVLEGLAEGESVVVSGNFLIDSESKMKAALGAAGHRH